MKKISPRHKAVVPPTPERSYIMRSVGQSGTKPELRVREACSDLGLRYRCNVKGLPGRPDLANVSQGFAVLVHGCFWHRHDGCSRATIPKRNKSFWMDKFIDNVNRDRSNAAELAARGLQVVTVWECETRDLKKLRLLIRQRLRREVRAK